MSKETEAKEKKLPISIGADPECNYMVGPQSIGASGLLGTLFAGNAESYRGFKCEGGGIGQDAGDVGEFRPTFAWSVKKLVENMKMMLGEIHKRGRIISASTKNDRHAIGGHMHFGISDTGAALAKIHRQLSVYCLPLMLGEDPTNVAKRMSGSSYGKIIGDSGYRSEVKGSHRTYEIRFLTAEWLTTPKIMAGVFAYMVTILHEIKAHPENFEKEKDILFKNDIQANAFQQLTVSEYMGFAVQTMKTIRKHIRSFELYKQHKNEINYIMRPHQVLRDKRKVDFDIMRGWKFLTEKSPNKKYLNNKNLIKRKLKDIDTDKLKTLLDFSYNDDTHVAQFVDELINRVLAFSWSLKNRYFFFGLRKGFEYPVISNGYHEILEAKDIKTTSDLAMVGQFMGTVTSKLSSKSKFNTYGAARSTIIVGLPYEMRIKKDIGAFIDLILELEGKTFKAIDAEKLIEDREIAAKTVHTEEEKEKIGKIYLLLSDKKKDAQILTS